VRYLNSGIFQHEVLEYVKGNNDVQKDVLKGLSEKQKVIIEMIIADPFLSAKAISEKISEKMSKKEGVNERTIERDLAKLKKLGILTCESGRKEDRRGIKV
jgi:ATP-dependent DNA helicase RecG